MDLPDCPPGAEGYQDSVTEVPKKLEDNCTKAEQEFQDHLNSLKIKIEDGTYRCMVERRGRDVSGKWIYLCYPCAAVCSGEAILQTHISGKKHKAKLSMKNVWPASIFDDHPYNQSENGSKIAATPKVLKKMAEEVELFHKTSSEMDEKYGALKDVRCHIQDTLDEVVAPLIGVEYLVEHPPQEEHYEPSYTCTLCYKQGHPRTIVNHMTCFWHRHNYLQRHFPKAAQLLKQFRQLKYRDGVAFIINRIAQRIAEKYGRMKPINIDKEEYEKEKERIHQWIFKGPHYCETKDCTFEEVINIDLINMLHKSGSQKSEIDPSPPIVAVPKPNNSNRATARRERRVSMESLSDLSDELERFVHCNNKSDRVKRDTQPQRSSQAQRSRYEPYPDNGRDLSSQRNKYAKTTAKTTQAKSIEPKRQSNYAYKLQVADEKRQAVEDSANKSLAYHEKNPEKHPLYPEEWKKFWNRRYKEIQSEGKDPSKHDFKPEWIVFWTGRMKELHKEELRLQVVEIYRKMCLMPPSDLTSRTPPPPPSTSPVDKRHKSSEHKELKRSSEPRRRSPEPRRRTPPSIRMAQDIRRRSPHYRRDHRSPFHHKRSPQRRHSPFKVVRSRSRSPIRNLRSPPRPHTMDTRSSRSPLSRRETSHRNRSPVTRNRSPVTRNRSPVTRNRSPVARNRSPVPRNRSPVPRNRSPAHRVRSPVHRNRSPTSRRIRSPVPAARTSVPRNRSSIPRNHSPDYSRGSRNRSPLISTLNTVLISDDELKPEDGASPWNSANSLESLGSLPDARSPPSPPSSMSRAVPPANADNVVATLRQLVALEDYLGSLGPKIVDLLAEAIRMEKEKANSSEELLERETAVVLIETAKEKLKGAAQAGLVAPSATAAVRAAVVRAAATLHEADKRTKKLKAESSKKAAVVPVAGVGAVDRVQIAQQMAAALVAQGKTDVSEEELAQLVEAVVGMAEAKKREADEKKQATARSLDMRPEPPTSMSSTASALQMLQSAYDDKKCEKEDAPDAMDGLSDSDLETLLKNFNELSAEEQHSLIAYLKKLEAREPQRVERLRQYVSAAAARAPARAPPPAPIVSIAPATPFTPAVDTAPVAIESDDDDYTVEEVFKSATAKVKEDKMRQEMEIVKKSLEESSVTPSEMVTAAPCAPAVPTNIDLGTSLSSAANLLALVQASLQSANKSAQAANPSVAEVVTSNTQPRSFGDKPDPVNPALPPIATQSAFSSHLQNQSPYKQQGGLRVLQNLTYIAKAPSEMHLGGSNIDTVKEPSFDANNTNAPKESWFERNNSIMHSEQGFGVHNQSMPSAPQYGGNTSNAQNDYGDNKTNVHNDTSNVHSDYSDNNTNLHTDYGDNNTNLHNKYGENTTNLHSEYGGENNAHGDYGSNNPTLQNESRFAGNNPRIHNEQPFVGGNSNMYNEPQSYNAPKWEPRQMPKVPMGPPRDQKFNNYPQDNYNQGDRGSQDIMFNQRPQPVNYNNMNSGRMQDNYDARTQNRNQAQYGNYDHSNLRGRGGGKFVNRGRGRGRGGW